MGTYPFVASSGGVSLPLTVANGGTGSGSQTAYELIAGGVTSTSPLQPIASSGTVGYVLTDQGAGALPAFEAATGGGAGSPGGLSIAALGLAMTTATPLTYFSNMSASAQDIFFALCTAEETATITKIGCQVQTGGVTAGTGVNRLAVYSEAGALLGNTGDMTTAFETPGIVEGSLVSGVAVTAGTNYYLALIANFTGTTLQVTQAALNQAPPSPINGHYLNLYNFSVTALPASVTPSGLSASGSLPYLWAR